MALVRILVDGYNLIHAWQRYSKSRENQSYSLLHNWPELAPGKPRFSQAAREELIHRLTLYRDAAGTPITIVFDGANADIRLSAVGSTADVEILFSRAGQTADQIIERVAHRMSSYGEVLAVTDDFAERDTVIAMGGMASSCLSFIQTVENTLGELADDVKMHNRKERNRYKR